MPEQYTAIKNSLLKQGKSKEEAERIAAATYNKNRPAGSPPVGPHSDHAATMDPVNILTVPPKKYMVRGVEAFAAGQHREGGKTYTEADLDSMVRNWHLNKAHYKPPFVIGHSEDQEVFTDTGRPKWGEIVNPRRQGNKLVVDIVGLPENLAKWISEGLYDAVSAEVYPTPARGLDGSGPMLRRLAGLGGHPPEIKTLANLPQAEPERYSESRNRRTMRITKTKTRRLPGGTFEIFSEVTPMDPREQLTSQHGMDPNMVGQMSDQMAEAVCNKFNEMSGDPAEGMDDDQAMGHYSDGMTKYAERMKKRFPMKYSEQLKKLYGSFAEGMDDNDEDDKMKPDQFAEQIEAIVTRVLESKSGATIKHINEAQKSAKKLDVEKFAEQLLLENKISPSEMDGKGGQPTVVDLLLLADDTTPIEKFSENGKPVTAFDLLKQSYANRQPRRGERIKGGFLPTDADAEKAKVEEHWDSFAEDFRKISTSKEEFIQAFEHSRKADPTVTAAKFLKVR